MVRQFGSQNMRLKAGSLERKMVTERQVMIDRIRPRPQTLGSIQEVPDLGSLDVKRCLLGLP